MRRPLALALGALALAGGGTAAGYLARGGEAARARRAEASSAALASEVRRTEAERDRLRAERDRLEAQLAAERSPPACPSPFLRTADAQLVPYFTVDYPCGWHVLYEPLDRPDDPARRGLQVDFLFLSALPISKAPRGGPVAEIEVADWYDDPADAEDRLPTFDEWLEGERGQFGAPQEGRVRSADGTAIVRLTGTIDYFDERVPATVYLWEYVDAINGDRRIVRAFSLNPAQSVRRALDRLARSFRVLAG